MTPEALDSLDKKELIGLVLTMAEQIAALQSRVAELEAKLSEPPKTPDNSSLPPSRGQKANIAKTAKKRRRKGQLWPPSTKVTLAPSARPRFTVR